METNIKTPSVFYAPETGTPQNRDPYIEEFLGELEEANSPVLPYFEQTISIALSTEPLHPMQQRVAESFKLDEAIIEDILNDENGLSSPRLIGYCFNKIWVRILEIHGSIPTRGYSKAKEDELNKFEESLTESDKIQSKLNKKFGFTN